MIVIVIVRDFVQSHVTMVVRTNVRGVRAAVKMGAQLLVETNVARVAIQPVCQHVPISVYLFVRIRVSKDVKGDVILLVLEAVVVDVAETAVEIVQVPVKVLVDMVVQEVVQVDHILSHIDGEN